jgi:hypothetical protein
MEKGEIRRSTHMDQIDAPTNAFIEEVIQELVLRMGEEARDRIFISAQELESEHHKAGSGVQSNNVLTIVWHNSIPAALVLETRDDFNFTNVQAVFLGPNVPRQNTIENTHFL